MKEMLLWPLTMSLRGARGAHGRPHQQRGRRWGVLASTCLPGWWRSAAPMGTHRVGTLQASQHTASTAVRQGILGMHSWQDVPLSWGSVSVIIVVKKEVVLCNKRQATKHYGAVTIP